MLLNLLKNNFGLKVLAVCLAVTAWGYFHLAAAPGTTAKFDQTLAVPIVVTGLKTGYQARYADKVATVVIEVPRNGTAVKPDQVQAVLDVGDLVDPGFHNVPVKIVSPDVDSPVVTPSTTTIRGVGTDLSRVTGVRVEIPIPSKPQLFDSMIRPTPSGAGGEEIANVQVSPNLVHVRANFTSATTRAK